MALQVRVHTNHAGRQVDQDGRQGDDRIRAGQQAGRPAGRHSRGVACRNRARPCLVEEGVVEASEEQLSLLRLPMMRPPRRHRSGRHPRVVGRLQAVAAVSGDRAVSLQVGVLKRETNND